MTGLFLLHLTAGLALGRHVSVIALLPALALSGPVALIAAFAVGHGWLGALGMALASLSVLQIAYLAGVLTRAGLAPRLAAARRQL